jgi:hypothetical protein
VTAWLGVSQRTAPAGLTTCVVGMVAASPARFGGRAFVAWYAVRDRDPPKARNLLIGGLVIGAVYIIAVISGA